MENVEAYVTLIAPSEKKHLTTLPSINLIVGKWGIPYCPTPFYPKRILEVVIQLILTSELCRQYFYLNVYLKVTLLI